MMLVSALLALVAPAPDSEGENETPSADTNLNSDSNLNLNSNVSLQIQRDAAMVLMHLANFVVDDANEEHSAIGAGEHSVNEPAGMR